MVAKSWRHPWCLHLHLYLPTLGVLCRPHHSPGETFTISYYRFLRNALEAGETWRHFQYQRCHEKSCICDDKVQKLKQKICNCLLSWVLLFVDERVLVVVGDTLVFLNEYFIELNQAILKFLNQFLNWIFRVERLFDNFFNWIFLKILCWIIL